MTPEEQHQHACDQLVAWGMVDQAAALSPDLATYQYDLHAGGMVVWNVSLAQCFIAQGQGLWLEEVPRAQMAHVAATYAYDRARVATVDWTRPGIAAPLLVDGQVTYVVIDGIHRLVRAYQLGQPFRVSVLSDADARACVLEAPPGVMP